MYTEECIQTFLEKQEQLFDEPVAETYEEAEEFLEDCMAVVADSIDEVRKYLSGMGADVDGMSKEELVSTSLYIGTVQNCTEELAARLLDLIKRLLDQSTRCGTSTYNQNCAVAQRSDKRSI